MMEGLGGAMAKAGAMEKGAEIAETKLGRRSVVSSSAQRVVEKEAQAEARAAPAWKGIPGMEDTVGQRDMNSLGVEGRVQVAEV